MGTQISLKLSSRMYDSAKEFADSHGFDSLQDFIREILRTKLFEKEDIGGMYTYLASEKALGKHWLSQKEDEAWAHLQKET